MTHPVEQLVDYVDGTLPPRERAVVREHLQTCARCRGEVALAAAARQALAELPEVRAPAGLGAATVRRAETIQREGAPDAGTSSGVTPLTPRGERKVTTAPAWYRWGGAAAAVAAAFLVVVLVLPKVGGGGDSSPVRVPAAEGTLGSEDASFTAAGQVQQQRKDYDTPDVQALAERYAPVAAPPPATEERGTTSGGNPISAPAADSVPGARACLEQAFPHLADEGPPVQLIKARFRGTPAYLGVFASGPGAGEDADLITVWVVSSEDCAVPLNTTQVRI